MPVRLEVEDRIGTIVLDRPPLNVLDRQHQRELERAAGEASRRTDDIRAVMICGAGGVFSSGADIREMHALPPEEMAAYAPALQRAFLAVATIPQPVCAAVEGFALGGGLELALAADFRLCARDAEFGLPEIKLGVIPGAGGTQRLARLVGPAKALEIAMTGRRFGSAEARELGIVDHVAFPGTTVAEARGLLTKFVAGPSAALAAVKRAIGAAFSDAGLEVESEEFAALFHTRDQRVGMGAFLDKREPRFD